MTKQEILDYVKQHPSGKVKLAVSDIDGVLRGKYIASEKFLGSVAGTLGFCDVVFGWDMNDAAYDNATYTGWHTGYPDADIQLDISTFRKIPWEKDVPFFLGDFTCNDGAPLPVCPRQLLRKVLRDSEALGYKPSFSQKQPRTIGSSVRLRASPEYVCSGSHHLEISESAAQMIGGATLGVSAV